MKRNPGVKSRVLSVLLSLLLAAALQAVPFLLSRALPDLEDVSVLIHAFFLYLVHPFCAAFFPFLLTRKYRVPDIACFFHFGVFLLLLPFYPDGKLIGILCLAIGAVSASAGKIKNRMEEKSRR